MSATAAATSVQRSHSRRGSSILILILPWEADLPRQVLSSHNAQIQIFPQYKIVLKDIFQDCFEADLGPDSWTGFHPAMERIYVVMELGRDD